MSNHENGSGTGQETAPTLQQQGRRVFLTNPQFQLKLVGFTLVIALLTVLIFYISNLYFIWRFIEIGRGMGIPDSHPFFRFIVEQKRVMTSIFAMTAAISTITAVVG